MVEQVPISVLDDISEEEWDELLRSIEADRAAKKLRRDNPYLLDLIRALHGYENGLARRMVLHFVRKRRVSLGLPVPRTFDDTVQQSLERYCEDSEVYRARGGPSDEALFRWPLGAGAGHWALNVENARRWVAVYREKRQRQKMRYQP